MSGHVEEINVRETSEAAAVPVQRVRLVSGCGLEGDRYYAPAGAGSGEALTLIAAEALEGLEADTGIRLSAADSRRQVLPPGIDLNALVGREFTVGSVRCRGVELCEPCAHLQSVTQDGVLKGLVHRGGLRADVLNDGDVAVGDAVTSAA
jgi:MOSC domain-containing protein YiiM